MSNKYVKVMFDTKSGASDFVYKINEVNVSNNWNPIAKKGRDFGGFNYTTDNCILRWLHRGDTLYDVEIPSDAENIKIEGATTIYRANKIIISNPRKITDDMALEFYNISNIPEKSYYKALAVVSLMNYKKTAYALLRDKINKNNISEVLSEWNDFISHGGKDDRKEKNELVSAIEEDLNEIKSNLLINKFIDQEPYIKEITKDKVINITGESGSGKSFYANKYLNDNNYIVIDTDVVFNDKQTDSKESLEIRELFKNRNKEDLINDFDNCYLEILNHFKNRDKIIVIDSAQYRNVKNVNILKGQIIVMRTSIDTCYERCLNRWKTNTKNYTEDEYKKYADKKIAMYEWYKGINNFLEKIDKI